MPGPLKRFSTSLRMRLLGTATLVLVVAFAVAAAGLERAYTSSALAAQEERMQALVYALLGAAEFQPGRGLAVANAKLPEPKLGQPLSGLEAAIFTPDGQVVWRSASAVDLPRVAMPPVGDWSFTQENGTPPRFVTVFGVNWPDAHERVYPYAVFVREDATAWRRQVRLFRQKLMVWMGGGGLAVLLAQLLALRFTLRPLRKMRRELGAIEAGGQESFQAAYPQELAPLTDGLNAMLAADRGQRTRYRNALGDLAHSLKTPLAVLHGMTEDQAHPLPPAARAALAEQVGHMRQITDYQLRRAAAAGRRALAEPVALKPVVDKLFGALAKVYARRGLAFHAEIPEGLRLRADTGDLFEMLGNLADNAAKWARQTVTVRARTTDRVGDRAGGRMGDRAGVEIDIDDDGPGFPPDAQAMLERGARADTRVPGQGLGLASVREVVEAYEGRLELLANPDGGARVRVRL